MTRKRVHHGSRRRGQHPRPHKVKAFIEGTLRVVRPGVAEVDTAEGTFAVARRGIREAMNGDEVQVSLVPMHGRGGERVAYVQCVLRRSTINVVGIYGKADPLGVVSPLDARMVHDFFVLPEDTSAQRLGVDEGDVVVARILEYPTRQSAGVATIERRLGSTSELDLNVEAVVASYGLATDFPPAVLQEAQGVAADVAKALEIDAQRRDVRSEFCFTIDPVDARDFDDAVGAVRLENGGYRVFVHIADVTHYVGWPSSMDAEARRRTCSVYLVDRVIPMLPERLCNDVCSLRPNEDRLAVTVSVDLDRLGRVTGFEAYRSAIRSNARLCYDEVDRLLEGDLPATALPCDESLGEDIAACIRLLDEIATLRRRVRYERGAIDFATVESKVVLDEAGHPVDVRVRKRTRATGLVEEAMLLANECVAKMLSDHDVATAYRVHERPAPEDLAGCVPVLRELDLLRADDAQRLASANPFVIQEVLERAEGTGAEQLANTLLLRAQTRAVYLPHNDGHYALGAAAYCHFTSPIRRYPDMLVHRALMWQLAGRPASKDYAQMERALPQLCRTCSEQERVAEAADRASERVKMAEYYEDRIGNKYSGVVVGCERFGLFVTLDETCAEGFLPVRSLGEEWFAYDAEHMSLVGESSGRTWRVGQRIAVEVVDVEVARGRIDLAIAGGVWRA